MGTLQRLTWLLLAACGAPPAMPIVHYLAAGDAQELRLSARGTAAAMVLTRDGTDEVELRQRLPEDRFLGRGPGSIVGVPSENDVLVVDPEQRLHWLHADRAAALPLPHGTRWRFVGGSVDHAAHAATVAFASTETGPGRVIVLAVDTSSLAAHGAHELPVADPESCGARGTGATLYVWCGEGVGEVERWRISRHDGTTQAWSTQTDMPSTAGRTEMRGEVTGDASALVVLHGAAETSRMRFLAYRALQVDASGGAVRTMHGETLSFIANLTPVPGRPEVACVRWLYRDFYGILVLDARALTVRVAVPADAALDPLALAVDPDGRFVVPGR